MVLDFSKSLNEYKQLLSILGDNSPSVCMEPVSHVALFYILGKKVRIDKLWAGMVVSVIPDTPLILFTILNPIFGFNTVSGWISDLYLFLHSIFALLLLLPIAIFSFRYFYASIAGYSLHLLLDYFTHTTTRLPFYPLTTWKAPIFLVSYFDPVFMVSVSVILLTILTLLYGGKLMSFTKTLFNNYQKSRLLLFLNLYIALVVTVVIAYVASIYPIQSLAFFFSFILISINLVLVGILFFSELNSDKNIRMPLIRLASKLLREK